MKKTETELELLTNTDMLQIIEKGIRGGICHVIHWEAKTKNYHIKCIGAQTINTDGQCLRNYLQAILNLKKAFTGKSEDLKSQKLICNLYDKEKYVVQIRTLKKALHQGLVLKKGQRIITFNQKAWLK